MNGFKTMAGDRKIFLVSTEVGVGKGGISKALVGLLDYFKQHRVPFNVIASHSGTTKGLFFVAARRLISDVSVNDIVWLHCGGWFSLLRKLALSFIPKLRGAKIVLQFHSQSLDSEMRNYPHRLLVKVAMLWAHRIVVLSPWWYRRVLSDFPHCERKLMIVPNVLNEQLAQISHNDPLTEPTSECCRILTMTRLVEGKGVEQVINTLHLLPQRYSLTIAGEGPLRATLEQQVARLNLQSRVTFTGWIDRENKDHAFRSHHIFFLPTQYDSFGMGFLEAMAYGLPVVALDFQAIGDVVADGATGVLCDADEAQQYAAAVEHCYNNWRQLSMAAKTHVRAQFSAPHHAAELIQKFETI